MGKLVKLSLEGQINSGYQVELVEIKEDGQDGRTLAEGVVGSLPPASQIYRDYLDWQKNYDCLNLASLRSLKKRGQEKLQTEISVEQCDRAAKTFKKRFNQWLNDEGFDRIENTLRTKLNEGDEIRFIIKTAETDLWKLPWSVWDFFEAYPNSEVAFSASEAKAGEKALSINPRKKVRILGICGDPVGIDYQNDQDNLKRLRSVGAEPEIYEEPSLQKVRDLLWEKTWDIFFFAGHSDSNADLETGRLYVNSKESLTPDEFKNSLKTAIEKGLKIAFLNSCDGLGLARQLVTELQIPLVIAMREPVPNLGAQSFLEYFLWEYAYRKLPLYVAVRKARQRIGEEWQNKLPSIDWLPVICQNPAIRPPKWQDLHRPVSLQEVGIASVISTSLVMAMRLLGMLQPLEFSAFDQLMRMRPAEPLDKRLLIVTVSERDIKEVGYPISDRTLEKALKKLEQYDSRVIGLDIYRDVPHGEGNRDLIKHLQQSDRVIVSCRVQEPTSENADNLGVPPPLKILHKQLGFNDILPDKDRTIRRQLLTMSPDEKDPCQTKKSLSFQLVLKFLQKETNSIIFDPNEGNDYWRFTKSSDPIFKLLKPPMGGYQKLDIEDTGGFQFLLNYRASQQIANRVSLTDVLNKPLDPNLVINRVVLIGYTAESVNDIHITPIDQEMPGVIVHAHMVSQMLSAVLDKRPLLWALPWWGDALCIFGYSLAGSLLVWRIQNSLLLLIAEGVVIVALPVFCLIILIKGGWMPLIPSTLALVFAGGGLVACIIYPTLQQKSMFKI